jgi:hypothetical protein
VAQQRVFRAGLALAGVGAAASGDVWAGGSYYEPEFNTQAYRTLIERYTLP